MEGAMLKVQIQLHRPFDRHPGHHLYGEPFDDVVNRCVGGEDRWSSPRNVQSEIPRASVLGHEISIELHEDGALIHFIVQHADKIPEYISAIAAVVSAWAA